MAQLCRASTLEVTGKMIASTNQPQTQKASMLDKRVTFLEDLDKVLKFWGVNQEINFNLLTPSCIAAVDALAKAISAPNHSIPLPEVLSEEATIQFVKIANLFILVFFIHIKDNIYALKLKTTFDIEKIVL